MRSGDDDGGFIAMENIKFANDMAKEVYDKLYKGRRKCQVAELTADEEQIGKFYEKYRKNELRINDTCAMNIAQNLNEAMFWLRIAENNKNGKNR